MISFQVVSLMARPAIDTRLMLLVTAQAPAHPDLYRPGDSLHGGHIAVAGRTRKTGPYVHHVREVDVVGHPVDPDPGNRFFIVPVRHELFYFRRVLGNEQMTCAAVRYCGDAGYRGSRTVTVPEKAGDAVVPRMHFVTEDERLDGRAVAQVERQNVQVRQDREQRGRS